jgi:hypothetical protein
MNERIKKLVARADMYANEQNELYGVSYSQTFNEKFAELVVQKCADIGERYADGNYEVRNQILIHFGLEEE